MREIKFRAWQKGSSLNRQPGMYEVTDIVWYDKTPDGYTGEVFFEKHSPGSEYLEDVELMQHTGLKDKNGVEIYEGDIVVSYDINGRKCVDVVSYTEGGYFYPLSGQIAWARFFNNKGKAEFEVTGNIYENPELLEKAA